MRKNAMDTLSVSLTDEQKKSIMNEIHNFFDEEYGEDIGIIKQQRIMELFMEQLAPMIYNKALDDAMVWYKRMQDNMEADYYALYKEGR
ncbi:MAG: DUF2164 family protein [Lachnospiraceae bacterium]|nr:DUF2164 family protein [Lachnospiraceae bacterium]